MKCIKCQGFMVQDFERKKCMICGFSVWRNFTMRKPLKSEINGAGCPTGSRAQGGDNIKARI
jgi:hypothetical protein